MIVGGADGLHGLLSASAGGALFVGNRNVARERQVRGHADGRPFNSSTRSASERESPVVPLTATVILQFPRSQFPRTPHWRTRTPWSTCRSSRNSRRRLS